jgi:hypothetical protein
MGWNAAARATDAIRTGSGDVLVPGPAEQAFAVPALDQEPDQALHGCGQPQTVGQHLGHLAERGDVALQLPEGPRHAPHDLHGPSGAGLAELANARMIPAIVLLGPVVIHCGQTWPGELARLRYLVVLLPAMAIVLPAR